MSKYCRRLNKYHYQAIRDFRRNAKVKDTLESIKRRIPVCCSRGFDIGVSDELINLLYRVSLAYNIDDLVFTSGVRCNECNRAVAGARNSLHLQGKAVDIAVRNSKERYELINLFMRVGVTRIGIGRDFIHIDVGDSKLFPDKVIWLY